MKKYQLIEKNIKGVCNKSFLLSSISNRFFFRDDNELCWKLDAHIDYMMFNGLVEIDLYLAERVTNTSYFFCKHFVEVGEKSEGGCGKMCKGYAARNGNSGACKHYGYTYEKTDRCFTLKLSNILVAEDYC